MVWRKNYAYSWGIYVSFLIIGTVITISVAGLSLYYAYKCYHLCSLNNFNPPACVRTTWWCRASYPPWSINAESIEVNYVFVAILVIIAAFMLFGLLRFLLTNTSYVEVSEKGIRVIYGFIREREEFIDKSSIVEAVFRPARNAWVHSILGLFGGALINYVGAGEAIITIKSNRKLRIILHAEDVADFSRAFENELGLKLIKR